MVGVTGSIPVAPTTKIQENHYVFWFGGFARCGSICRKLDWTVAAIPSNGAVKSRRVVKSASDGVAGSHAGHPLLLTTKTSEPRVKYPKDDTVFRLKYPKTPTGIVCFMDDQKKS
jgi:hypothetical protein